MDSISRLRRWLWVLLSLSMLWVSPSVKPMSFPRITFESDVYFELNSAELTSTGVSTIDRLVAQAGTVILESVILIGHVSIDESNPLILGERRAKAVKTLLLKRGVPADRVFWESRGSGGYIEGVDRDKSRRVELGVVGAKH